MWKKMNQKRNKKKKKMIRKRKTKNKLQEDINRIKKFWHKWRNYSPIEWRPNGILMTNWKRTLSQLNNSSFLLMILRECSSTSHFIWQIIMQIICCNIASKAKIQKKPAFFRTKYYSQSWEKLLKILS